MKVAVVQTAVANLASVLAALERAGGEPQLGASATDISDAPFLVLPGVGAFGACVETLEKNRLTDALRQRIAANKPTLAICLGMQLLCEASEESPGSRGLGIIPKTVRRLRDVPRVPQLGWNSVTPLDGTKLLREGYAYFANSYAVEDAPEGWSYATTSYGRRFISAIERGPVLACQFHPELSGSWGTELIQRWLRESAAC